MVWSVEGDGGGLTISLKIGVGFHVMGNDCRHSCKPAHGNFDISAVMKLNETPFSWSIRMEDPGGAELGWYPHSEEFRAFCVEHASAACAYIDVSNGLPSAVIFAPLTYERKVLDVFQAVLSCQHTSYMLIFDFLGFPSKGKIGTPSWSEFVGGSPYFTVCESITYKRGGVCA